MVTVFQQDTETPTVVEFAQNIEKLLADIWFELRRPKDQPDPLIVPAPVVEVPPTDLTPLADKLDELQRAVESLKESQSDQPTEGLAELVETLRTIAPNLSRLRPSLGGGGANLGGVETKLQTIIDSTPHLTGTFGYEAATLTTGSLSATGRVVALRVYADGPLDGSFNISGGDTINVRADTGIDLGPDAQLVNPTINWVSGTLDCFVAVLND